MTHAELMECYERLYTTMATSKDVAKMKIFGAADKKMFNKMAEAHPDFAAEILAFLAAVEYHNYVTSAEATTAASRFINDDKAITGATEPTHGPHWSMDGAKSFLTTRNIPVEDKPYYNWPALWLTMNMIYSDFASALSELLGSKENDKLAVASYKMAVKKLKDLDRPHFIREYFGLDS